MNPKDKTLRGREAHVAHQSWPAQVRLELARLVVERGASAATLSQALGIPATTVSEWAKRCRRFGGDWVTGAMPVRCKSKRALDPRGGADPRRDAVVDTKREHPEHGVRRIRDVLQRFEGLGVSETTV